MKDLIKEIKFNGMVVRIVKGTDGLWRDRMGTVYAYQDDSASVDPEVRLGVGALSLSKDNPLTPAAVAHDYAYATIQYQMTHNRSEADYLFFKQMQQLAGNNIYKKYIEAPILYIIARIAGKYFWEVAETKDK